MTRTRGATSGQASGAPTSDPRWYLAARPTRAGPPPAAASTASVGLGDDAAEVADVDLLRQPPDAPPGVRPVAAHRQVEECGCVGVVTVAGPALDDDVERVGMVAGEEGARPQAQVVGAR